MAFWGWLNRKNSGDDVESNLDSQEEYADTQSTNDGRNLWTRGGRFGGGLGRRGRDEKLGNAVDDTLEEEQIDYEQLQRDADLAQARAYEAKAELLRRGKDGRGRYNPMGQDDMPVPDSFVDEQRVDQYGDQYRGQSEGQEDGFEENYEVEDDEWGSTLVTAAAAEEGGDGERQSKVSDSGPVTDILVGLVTGNILENSFVGRFAMHAVVLFALSFISICVWFWSLNVDAALRSMQNEVQLLHENSLEVQKRRIAVSSFSAVESEVERRKLGLIRSTRPSRNM